MADAPTGKHSSQRAGVPAPSGKRTALKVLLGIMVACVVVGAGYVGVNYYQQVQSASQVNATVEPPTASVEVTSTEPAVQKVDNPIDFKQLQAENPDIVAYISVPDTNVSYPVLRSTTDDSYYLDHDVDGNATVAGSIYMEMKNQQQFLDYVTVLYGHCLQVDTMFTTLHNFEDPTFFNTHPTFYIYIPEHIYTYTVISAFNYDDRHILNSFNFNDPSVRASYYAMLQNPDSLVVQKRSGLNITTDSKIVQLSTCLSGYSYDNQRYIVSGVLTNEQLTN